MITKWFIYTVLVGLIPVFLRLLIWIVTKEGAIEPLSVSDFVAFGLVLNISNINVIEQIHNDRNWKTIFNGISTISIVLFSSLYALTLIGGAVVDNQLLLTSSCIFSFISLLFSFAVFYRIKLTDPQMNHCGNSKDD